MKIATAPTARAELIGALRANSAFGRDTGVIHGSDVQFCLLKSTVRKHVQIGETDQDTIIFAAGRGYEEILIARRNFHMLRHEVIERDGMYFTPDLTDISAESSKIVEIKSTRKSAAHFNRAEDFDDPLLRTSAQRQALGHYLDQAMTYCAASQKYTQAQIDIICINGDYGGKCEGCEQAVRETGSPHPRHEHGMSTLHCYEIEFSEQELESWWTNHVIPRYVNYIGLQTAVQDVPVEVWATMMEEVERGRGEGIAAYDLIGLTDHPFDQVIGYPFECEHCPILKLCKPPHMEALLRVMAAGKRSPTAPGRPEEIGGYIETLTEMMIQRPRKNKGNAIVEGTQITALCSGPKPKHEKCPGQGHDGSVWMECRCSCPHQVQEAEPEAA